MTTSEKKYLPMTKLYDLQEGAYWDKSADDRLQVIEKCYDDNNSSDMRKIIQMVQLKVHDEAFGSRDKYTTHEKRVRRVSDANGSIYSVLKSNIDAIKRSFPNNNLYVLKEEEIPSREDFESLINEVRTILGFAGTRITLPAKVLVDMIVSEDHSHKWDYNPALKEGEFKLPDDFLDNLKVKDIPHYYGDIWGNGKPNTLPAKDTLNALGEKIGNMDFTKEKCDSEMYAEFEDRTTDKIFQYWKANKVANMVRSLTGKEITERVLEHGIGLTKREIEIMLTTRYWSTNGDINYKQVIVNFDAIMRYIKAGGNVITHSNIRDCYTDSLGVWPYMSKSAPTNKRYNSIVFNKDLFEMMQKEWRPEWEEKAALIRDTEKNDANYHNVINYVANASQDRMSFEEYVKKGKKLCATDFDNILKNKMMSMAFGTGLLENLRGQYQPLLYNAANEEKDLTWDERNRLTKEDNIYNGKNNWNNFRDISNNFMRIDNYRFCFYGKNENTPTTLEIRQAKNWAESKGLKWDTDYEQINNASKLLDASIRNYHAQRDIVRIMFETSFNNFVSGFINGGEEE